MARQPAPPASSESRGLVGAVPAPWASAQQGCVHRAQPLIPARTRSPPHHHHPDPAEDKPLHLRICLRRLLHPAVSLLLLLLAVAVQLFVRGPAHPPAAGQPVSTNFLAPREIFQRSVYECSPAVALVKPTAVDFAAREEDERRRRTSLSIRVADMSPSKRDGGLVERAKKIAKDFEYSPEDVRKSVKEFLRLMDLGLQKDYQAMAMIPTYITSVPNGTEKGVYLAVDLGGTNFRVCSVTLGGDSTFILTQQKAPIPRSLMTSDSHSLFSFMAKQIELFVKEHHADHFEEDKEHNLQLGFTFSFPINQKGINKGFLIRWTKGFDIPDAVGKDVCALLQAEIDKLGLPVTVAALVNDTVGTLMARSYTSPGKTGALLGTIFGTGTNGAYIEKLNRIGKMTAPGADFGEYDTSTGEMIINTEWGSFDNAMRTLPDTLFDQMLDKNTPNPGMQMFEKRVSGMFLGEILRNAITTLRNDSGLFSAVDIPPMAPVNEPWGLDTSVLSFIEADDSPDLGATKKVIEEQLGVPVHSVSQEEAEAMRILVHAIGKRSARLSAVPVAAVMIATGKMNPSSTATMTRRMSLLEMGNHILRTAMLGKAATAAAIAPVVDAPPPARNTVREDKNAATTSEELEVVDVGVDGSVVEFYPGFEKYIREALREVGEVGLEGEKRIRMGVAKDGSGVGAALIALVAAKAKGIHRDD